MLCDWYGLELKRWHMFLASEELASLTMMNQAFGIRYGGGPVEPLPVCPARTAANPCMNVL
jgi:hypothetical protein